MEALLSAHGIAQTIEALTNSQALYLGTFARIDALRDRLAAEGQGGFVGADSGLTSEAKAADHAELTRLRGEGRVQEVDDAQITAYLAEHGITDPSDPRAHG